MIDKIKKSESGFTMQDLMIAILIIMLFVGIVASLMYSVYKINAETSLMMEASAYAVELLEDIDKIAYEEVDANLESIYDRSLPAGFNVDLEITNYGEEQNLQDVIKIVKLTISYEFLGNTSNVSVTKLKIKEIWKEFNIFIWNMLKTKKELPYYH